jgi:aryl-alcohol dehydrogenase-like predicted oxidoreductase
VAYLAFGPLAGGWLTGKYRRGVPYPAGSRMTQRPEPYQELVADRTFEALARLQAMAADRGTSRAGLALAWLLADDRVTQIVIGPGRPEHLAPVAEALAHPLTQQEQSTIEEAVAGLVPEQALVAEEVLVPEEAEP